MDKKPNTIDRYVGQRVYGRRNVCGMTQRQLADAIGVTYQQLQKYERGINRIGPSRLYSISQVLEVPVTYFFEGVEEALRGAPAEVRPPEPPRAAVDTIQHEPTRRAIMALCKAVVQSRG